MLQKLKNKGLYTKKYVILNNLSRIFGIYYLKWKFANRFEKDIDYYELKKF